ncbi:retrovirus-related Pol polyprotein from transposon 412 [Trichonephila clavipes]|nr:retrovirus-related Pol polyprotein from transposon 412 [Trichonephila clavipes]
MIRWALKLSEFNIEWEHRPGVQNVVADVLSRNPVGNMDGSQISCAALRALALNSREQLIREQREDPELGHIYGYLENPDDSSINATVCEGWSQDFKLIDGLFFYAREKYSTTLGELRVYIPKSLREAIMQEFHDLPLAGHIGKRKTNLKLRDTCYFSYMRKYIFEYVSTCDRCQKFNYKNALPADRLFPIVSNYPNEIVTLDLLGPYPASRPKRYGFLLVITDHFTKWSELIPLRKASAQAIANALFENYISRYGASISLISDNSPQFISEVFEHISHRLDIKHIKTVTYRPQANLTERVNRTLVQMIACFVEENHENWDQFLHEFAFALRTSVKEATINIDQARVYHPRQSDTISSDSHVETLYEGQRSSNGSSRSYPGKSKRSRKTSSEESKGRKSNKRNAGWDDPRLKRKVGSNGSVDRTDKKRSKICRKRSLQGSEHGDQKRPTPEPTHGIKRTIPSSVSSRKYKYKRSNNPSQGSQSIAGPSHQIDTRKGKPPTEGSRQGASVQYDRARETRTTPRGGDRAAERRPARSIQATAVRPCPCYLRSRVKQPEGIPEEQRSNGIDSIPQNNLRRWSLSMEALDGDPVDRSQ